MAERQTVAQRQQIGKETTHGTPVAATKRLGSINFNPGVNSEADMFRPRGLKFATVQAQNREWTEGDIDGKPTYEEVIIPLASVIGAPTTSTVMDDADPTSAKQHVFTPNSSAADNPVTFTLEQGDDVTTAEKMAHLLVTAFSLEVSRAEVNLGGNFIAQSIIRDITLTPSLALPAHLTPILPGQFSLYTAETAAALGTDQDQLLKVISANPQIGDRFMPTWFVNAALPSFATFTENAEGPTAENQITVEADDAGMVFLDKLRTGETIYLRLEALGAEIDEGIAATRRRFCWDMAIKNREPDTWSDEDGIWAIPFTFQMVHDTTWGKAMQITVVNDVATV